MNKEQILNIITEGICNSRAYKHGTLDRVQARGAAYSVFDELLKAELLLLNKPTVAITETAHCANTLLSECADSGENQIIGVVGAGSSETEIVKQNEQTKELCPKCHADEFEHRRFGKICCSCKTWLAY